MEHYKIVLDTNVIVSALRSRRGAGHSIMSALNSGVFTICISVPLILEYEEILKLKRPVELFSEEDIEELVDFICSIGRKTLISNLWRPTLRDPDDEMVLEVAVASKADFIVTYNVKDFVQANIFNVKVITPGQFLKLIRR